MPDIMNLISEAEYIKTSGRWSALNEKIKKLPPISDDEFGWLTRVFSGLTYRVFYEYLGMQEAHKRADDELAIVAWHARNLLELAVWSLYCTKSEDNTRRFYEDAGRDYNDLLLKLKKWGGKTNQGNEWQQMFTDSLQDLSKAAAQQGISDLNSKYLQVSEVAKDLGMKDDFETTNKMLSKYAHPTAGYVVRPFDGEDVKKLKTAFLIQGCVNFLGAFNALEQHFKNNR